MKYRWKTRPYRHQVQAVKDALHGLYERGSFALLMAPRTGKTKTAIDVASIMHQKGDVNRVLVICPVSVIDVWVKEIKTHCPFKFRITVWDKEGRKTVGLPRWGSDILDFVIINYDAFSAPGAILSREGGVTRRSSSRGGRYSVKNAIKKWSPQLGILDESHRIKSPSARKTSTIRQIAFKMDRHHNIVDTLIPYRLILTGTVMTKKKRVFDIYSQWKNWLNPFSPLVEDMTLKEFKDEYAVWTERNGYPQWLRNKPRAMLKLRELMHEEAFAITRDECYDLPPAFEPVIHLIELEESAKYYDQMAEEMVAMLESGEFTWAKIPLVQRLRLQQLTSGIAKTEPTKDHEEGRLVRVGREKLRFLEDLLIDQFEADEKVVIGARFHGDLQGIEAVCKKLKVPSFELSGRVTRADRTKNIEAFRKMEGAAAFIAQPAAGSLGIDLSTAATMIWYSLVDSWVDYEQFKDRVALSPRAVRYIYLLARGTIDEVKYEGLQEDGDIARMVTDSPQRLLRNFKNETVAPKKQR